MKVSEYYEIPIYSDKGNYIGEVENVMLDPEKEKVAGLVFDQSGDRNRMVPYDSVMAVGDIIIVTSGEKGTATTTSSEESVEQSGEESSGSGSEELGEDSGSEGLLEL